MECLRQLTHALQSKRFALDVCSVLNKQSHGSFVQVLSVSDAGFMNVAFIVKRKCVYFIWPSAFEMTSDLVIAISEKARSIITQVCLGKEIDWVEAPVPLPPPVKAKEIDDAEQMAFAFRPI